MSIFQQDLDLLIRRDWQAAPQWTSAQYMPIMARRKEFDEREALDAAVEVFREHGFEGTSAAMLVETMKIGGQSIYDTFGDKWQLYLSALHQYGKTEAEAHVVTLKREAKAFDGIKAAVDRVVNEARLARVLGRQFDLRVRQ